MDVYPFSSHHRTLFEILILFFQIVSVYLSPNEFRYWLCSTTTILPRKTLTQCQGKMGRAVSVLSAQGCGGTGRNPQKNPLPEALCGGVPCAGFFQVVKICANETVGQGKNGAAKKKGGNFGGS